MKWVRVLRGGEAPAPGTKPEDVPDGIYLDVQSDNCIVKVDGRFWIGPLFRLHLWRPYRGSVGLLRRIPEHAWVMYQRDEHMEALRQRMKNESSAAAPAAGWRKVQG